VDARRVQRSEGPGELVALTSRQDGGKTIIEGGLGGAARLDLSWTFPRVEGQTGSQVESLSFTVLGLLPGGADVDRREKLRVTGRRVDSVEFRILGGWRITEITGTEVSEWAVVRAEGSTPAGSTGNTEKLQVFFASPVETAELRIRGRALLETEGPLPGLALIGAARVETLIGVRHAGLRRFRPDILGGMRRASREDLLRSFPLGEAEIPDRIYQAFGSGEGEKLAVESLAPEATVATEIVAVIGTDRLAISVRSRYGAAGAGPLRHEVPVPKGWSVRSVKGPAVRSWEVVPGTTADRLVVDFTGRAPDGAEIAWAAENLFVQAPQALELPPLAVLRTAAGPLRESVRWSIAADDEIDVSLGDAGGLSSAAVDPAPAWSRLPPGPHTVSPYAPAAPSRGKGRLQWLCACPGRPASSRRPWSPSPAWARTSSTSAHGPPSGCGSRAGTASAFSCPGAPSSWAWRP
jgi:hypothetical protein